MNSPSSLQKRNRRRASGVATIEFAVCLPILVIVIFGSIEACNMIFLKQSLTEASHQGALLAMKQSSNRTASTDSDSECLRRRKITGATIEIAGGNYATLLPGDLFRDPRDCRCRLQSHRSHCRFRHGKPSKQMSQLRNSSQARVTRSRHV